MGRTWYRAKSAGLYYLDLSKPNSQHENVRKSVFLVIPPCQSIPALQNILVLVEELRKRSLRVPDRGLPIQAG